MTLIDRIKKGDIPDFLEEVAKSENVSVDFLISGILNGTIVIPNNKNHSSLRKYMAIGESLKIKVNANIGTSLGYDDFEYELKKFHTARKFGADSVMLLSTWGDIEKQREKIINMSDIPIGTVPIYDVAVVAYMEHKNVVDFSEKDFLKILENHAKQGVDFVTLHVSITKDIVKKLKNSKRIMRIVSRGGSIISGWIIKNDLENPFYKYFDEVLDIAREYDVTLSLGDSLRPGNLFDSMDKLQLEEWFIFEELVEKARKKNVQVILEGPGHVPINQIESTVQLMKKYGKNSPVFLLGPIVLDIAPGYDHITSAIGAAIAAKSGADFICYVTPSEHLSLPSVEDVKLGVISSKIAGMAVDFSRGKHIEENYKLALFRKNLDWDGIKDVVLDREIVEEYLDSKPFKGEGCSMCGPFCSLKIVEEYLEK
ncbi:phosphomethylpyrimidine synthase [Thermosipho melanesiensis]|uniref:Phosphomethylpyrimidine synthase n=2 Tax=Thermosipho melanesiensis TaxID=46541 RepID=A6LND5_THEM4|nr:phosphomethylpyrimidine synthase ThiC [Thermosipho melanesiensis]ABR31436.1 thiamine biosynthesis protein ThiC [Thermosipho melanesiensis BI429]APT74495.1 phosphomethylpyrimidine synthase [Thermosipho melanesiensis]OOC36804.1 phosphomethylpyrimidine synthase [Thermosipho melanesiensis]OOC37341.1 phosphomethylpyrimidine synthase [Thermosipho melanesiensis]OOC38093.1 phosphomethylpyrimidine synthase [Thermosipho melanesiensis]